MQKYVVWAAYDCIRFIWESSSALHYYRLTHIGVCGMGRILSYTYLSGFIMLYFHNQLLIIVVVLSLSYLLLYCMFMLQAWPQPHYHYYLYTYANPARLWALLSLLGLLSDNPGLVCSRYLCLDHGAGTVLEGLRHPERLVNQQEIIAFRLSSRRHLFSLIPSFIVSSAWSLTSVRSWGLLMYFIHLFIII